MRQPEEEALTRLNPSIASSIGGGKDMMGIVPPAPNEEFRDVLYEIELAYWKSLRAESYESRLSHLINFLVQGSVWLPESEKDFAESIGELIKSMEMPDVDSKPLIDANTLTIVELRPALGGFSRRVLPEYYTHGYKASMEAQSKKLYGQLIPLHALLAKKLVDAKVLTFEDQQKSMLFDKPRVPGRATRSRVLRDLRFGEDGEMGVEER